MITSRKSAGLRSRVAERSSQEGYKQELPRSTRRHLPWLSFACTSFEGVSHARALHHRYRPARMACRFPREPRTPIRLRWAAGKTVSWCCTMTCLAVQPGDVGARVLPGEAHLIAPGLFEPGMLPRELRPLLPLEAVDSASIACGIAGFAHEGCVFCARDLVCSAVPRH
jgi:hypothetical protein